MDSPKKKARYVPLVQTHRISLTWSRIDFTKTVTVCVDRISDLGGDRRFEVPYDVLSPRSPCAIRAQRSKNDIELCSHLKEAFSTYLQLLFTGKVLVREVKAQEHMDDAWKRLVDLYLVAVKMEDAESVNQAIDEMWKTLQNNGMSELLAFYAFNRRGMLKVRQMLTNYVVESEDDNSKFTTWLYGERNSDLLDEDDRQQFLPEVTKEFMRRRKNGRAPGGGSKAGAVSYHIQGWRLTQDGKTVKPEGMEDTRSETFLFVPLRSRCPPK